MEEEDIFDEKSFITSKDKFYNFRKKLIKDIKNTTISMNNEACYLINESFNNEFIKNFNKYENDKKQNKINKKTDFIVFIPDIEKEFFINNFSSIIKNLKRNIKINLISFKLIYNLYEEDELFYSSLNLFYYL